MASGGVKWILHLEGLCYFVIAVIVYRVLGGYWLTFLLLIWVPDISFAAYAYSARAGTLIYNTFHSTIGPLLLAIFAYFILQPDLYLWSAIWLAHIGADRALGYGLKYESGFKDTHLGRI